MIPKKSFSIRKLPLYIKQFFLYDIKNSPAFLLKLSFLLLTFGTECKQCLLSLLFWKSKEENKYCEIFLLEKKKSQPILFSLMGIIELASRI